MQARAQTCARRSRSPILLARRPPSRARDAAVYYHSPRIRARHPRPRQATPCATSPAAVRRPPPAAPRPRSASPRLPARLLRPRPGVLLGPAPAPARSWRRARAASTLGRPPCIRRGDARTLPRRSATPRHHYSTPLRNVAGTVRRPPSPPARDRCGRGRACAGRDVKSRRASGSESQERVQPESIHIEPPDYDKRHGRQLPALTERIHCARSTLCPLFRSPAGSHATHPSRPLPTWHVRVHRHPRTNRRPGI